MHLLLSGNELGGQKEMLETLREIAEYTQRISSQSESTFWHRGNWEVLLDSMALIASVLAMLAVVTIVYEYAKIKRNRNCQSQVFGEIIRYLYVNDTIIEILRLKMDHRGWYNCHPHEAIIRRFKFPDKDLEISDFTVTSKNYDQIREFQLFLRNYNIMADVTAKHFDDETLDRRIKINDLADLQDRSRRILLRIQKLNKDFNLRIPAIEQYIPLHHRSGFRGDDLILTPAEMEIVKDVIVPPQYAAIANHYLKAVADRYVKYYDIEIFPLHDEYKDYGPYSEESQIVYKRNFNIKEPVPGEVQKVG